MNLFQRNTNLVRHDVLNDCVIYILANSLHPQSHNIPIEDIITARGNATQRQAAMNFLLASKILIPITSAPGTPVRMTAVSELGSSIFYTEQLKERGKDQVKRIGRVP